MYTKLKYIILTIIIAGIGFGIFSYLKFSDYGNEYLNFIQSEFLLPSILTGLIIVFFFLPRSIKKTNRILTFSALGISLINLIICLNLTLNYFSIQRTSELLAEFHNLNCEQIEKRFEKDLKNDELKYFSFGLVGSENLTNNLKKYDIENFDMGCTVYDKYFCYNKLVNEYLRTNENVEITQLTE